MGFKSDIQATNVSLSMTGRNADGDLATTLDGALTAASTSVVVDDITGFPTTADGGGVLEIGNWRTCFSNWEYIYCTWS
jgi:hypothetical protein